MADHRSDGVGFTMFVSRQTGPLVRRSLVLMLAVVATLGVGVVGPAHAGPSHSTDGVRYVALGDSRAAGPTITASFNSNGCSRSGGGYPERLARALKPASFTDVACGGAKSADVVDSPQRTSLPVVRTVPVQANALRRDTTLVTLSIGGNDIGWGGLISPCFGLSTQIDVHCRTNAGLRAQITERFAKLDGSLNHVFDVIKQRSPDARIFVVGHGGYYGQRGCFPDATLSNADAPFLAEFFRRFDSVLSDAARRNGAQFVDIAGPAAGHDACAPLSKRWFTGQLPVGNFLPNHPTQLGNAAIARLVQAAIAR